LAENGYIAFLQCCAWHLMHIYHTFYVDYMLCAVQTNMASFGLNFKNSVYCILLWNSSNACM